MREKCFAFALRDFDTTRILSRKFFAGLNLPSDKPDQEILKSFKHSTIEETEKSVEKLSKILQRLKEYLERIKTHSERLEDLQKKIAIKYADVGGKDSRIRFKHTKFLLERYKEFVDGIVALGGVVSSNIDGSENLIESICRRNFAERLKQARKSAGLTQKELAEKIGISRPDLALFENARKSPSFFTLNKILRRTNFSADLLLK